jgi:hypothetical protein
MPESQDADDTRTTLLDTRAALAPRMAERRGTLRYPCELQAFCQASAGESDTVWCAWVRNVSRSGIRLLLRARPRPHTRLTVGLLVNVPGLPRTVLADVMHSVPLRYGGWLVGCRFVQALDDDQFHALLDRVNAFHGT